MLLRRRRQPRTSNHELALATREATDMRDPDAVLDIRGLRTTFHSEEGKVHAVDGIDLLAKRGRTTCIVGESGSGKSATARSILQVVENPGLIDAGEMLFRATSDGAVADIASLDPHGPGIRSIRGRDIGMIFQEPMSALSPVHTIGNQISEMLQLHTDYTKEEIRKRVIDELESVGIPRPAERIDSYAFQLSGGMRQRAMIAMALITRPSLLIADEPTTALDVTTQAQILDLLEGLKRERAMTMVLITHDLGVVAEMADDVVVMRHGKVLETGEVDQIFHEPQHPYTRQLLDSLPQRPDRATLPADKAAPSLPPPSTAVQVVKGAPDKAAQGGASEQRPLLQIKGLRMEFEGASGAMFRRRKKEKVVAVDDVSLDIPKGSTFGLVGESGCGKTTLGRCLMRAYEPTSGEIVYDGNNGPEDLAKLSNKQLLPYRRQIRMVFQDPYGSLNPRMTVRQVVGEPLRVAGLAQGSELDGMVEAMLERVGLSRTVANRYPHAFSGGERQRIGIARALVTNPKLVIADEAVSALDVSVRTHILELLADLQKELDLTYLFISHDLSVVERNCDRVAVMYYGNLVEEGPAGDLFANPQHGYTRALLSAIPVADPRLRGSRERIRYQPAMSS